MMQTTRGLAARPSEVNVDVWSSAVEVSCCCFHINSQIKESVLSQTWMSTTWSWVMYRYCCSCFDVRRTLLDQVFGTQRGVRESFHAAFLTLVLYVALRVGMARGQDRDVSKPGLRHATYYYTVYFYFRSLSTNSTRKHLLALIPPNPPPSFSSPDARHASNRFAHPITSAEKNVTFNTTSLLGHGPSGTTRWRCPRA